MRSGFAGLPNAEAFLIEALRAGTGTGKRQPPGRACSRWPFWMPLGARGFPARRNAPGCPARLRIGGPPRPAHRLGILLGHGGQSRFFFLARPCSHECFRISRTPFRMPRCVRESVHRARHQVELPWLSEAHQVVSANAGFVVVTRRRLPAALDRGDPMMAAVGAGVGSRRLLIRPWPKLLAAGAGPLVPIRAVGHPQGRMEPGVCADPSRHAADRVERAADSRPRFARIR